MRFAPSLWNIRGEGALGPLKGTPVGIVYAVTVASGPFVGVSN